MGAASLEGRGEPSNMAVNLTDQQQAKRRCWSVRLLAAFGVNGKKAVGIRPARGDDHVA
jgi:hypothetical protein